MRKFERNGDIIDIEFFGGQGTVRLPHDTSGTFETDAVVVQMRD